MRISMRIGDYELGSIFARRYFGKGLKKGIHEGELETTRTLLVELGETGPDGSTHHPRQRPRTITARRTTAARTARRTTAAKLARAPRARAVRR